MDIVLIDEAEGIPPSWYEILANDFIIWRCEFFFRRTCNCGKVYWLNSHDHRPLPRCWSCKNPPMAGLWPNVRMRPASMLDSRPTPQGQTD